MTGLSARPRFGPPQRATVICSKEEEIDARCPPDTQDEFDDLYGDGEQLDPTATTDTLLFQAPTLSTHSLFEGQPLEPGELQLGNNPRAARSGAGAQAPLTIKWDDSNMKSSYTNVCNMTSTREEVALLFGINQGWHAGQKEVTVQLTDRLILSPFAAERLSMLLTNVLREHEARFRQVPVETARTDLPPAS